MSRLGRGTLISALVNVLLSLSIINTYFDNESFKSYVNQTLSQIYPFIVLTIGLGGGSALGYLVLRKRHLDRMPSRHLRPKPFRLGTTLGSSSLPQNKLGSPGVASQVSRHTVYAVPPLSTSSSPLQKTIQTSPWSTDAKRPAFLSGAAHPEHSATIAVSTNPPSPAHHQGTEQFVRPPSASLQLPRIEQPYPIPPVHQNEFPAKTIVPAQVKSEPFASLERKLEPSTSFQRPSGETVQKPEASIGSQSQGSQQPVPQPPPLPEPRWRAPEPGARQGQWQAPMSKQDYPIPQKWVPPPNLSPRPQQQSPGSFSMRQGQGPMIRPGVPPPQGMPRQTAYPGPIRPGAVASVGPPRPFRPNLPGSPRITGPQQQPPGPVPGPEPKLPDLPSIERKDSVAPVSSNRPMEGSRPELPAPLVPAESKDVPEKPIGEMDWDTALDTILKTLRKDKVVEK